MQLRHFLPHKKLQHLIKLYWELDVNELSDQDKVHSFFPIDAIEIIFHLQNPFLRLQNNTLNSEPECFIEGQQSGSINVKQQGNMKTIGISMYPWATPYFFNTTPSAFTDRKFHVSEVDKELYTLYTTLTQNNHQQTTALCDAYFLAKLEHNKMALTGTDRMLINLMDNSSNYTDAKGMRKKWPFSTRHFEKKCLNLMGVSAGDIIKKRRMKTALGISLSTKFVSFTDVAHTAGFYDQAHFIKDFKYYFDKSPKAFFKDENPYLRSFL